MAGTVSSDSVAQDQLRAFVERIERLEKEQRAINDDKSEVYKEAKGNGFDVKVLRKVIADRRKDYAERVEFETIYDLYVAALGEVARAHVETPSEFGNSSPIEHDADTGEIIEPQPETAVQTVAALPGPSSSAAHEAVGSAAPIPQSRLGDDDVRPVEAERMASLAGVGGDTDRQPVPVAAAPDKPGEAQSSPAPRAPILINGQPLRPHCLHPELCAGQGRQHCHACTKAMHAAEAA